MKFNWINLGFGNRPSTLCQTCTHVHMQRGTQGEELVFCNFAYGAPRLVNFVVSDCTDYGDRRVQVAPNRAGFVRPDDFNDPGEVA